MSFWGSLRSVTEGARVTLVFQKFYHNAFSLTRLRRELPPGGSLDLCAMKAHLLFLTSTAFVGTKAKDAGARKSVFLLNFDLHCILICDSFTAVFNMYYTAGNKSIF